MMNKFNRDLEKKLEGFISKYYKNQMIRGVLIILGFSILLLLIFVIAEYYYYFSRVIRTIIFYVYVAAVGMVFSFYILLPILKLTRVIKGIDYYDANSLLSKEIPEIQDKIINSLHLDKLRNNKNYDHAVIREAINQKISKIKPLDFNKIIRYRATMANIKYVVPFILILLGFIIVIPDLVTGPVSRYVHHSVEYSKPVPFTLSLLNDSMKAVQGEDFRLIIQAEGEEIPEEIVLDVQDMEEIKLKENKKKYDYLFKNVQDEIQFRIKTEEIISNLYTLKVFPRPIILEFDISVIKPAYTELEKDLIKNNGNIVVPEGSQINWRFYTKDADALSFYYVGIKNELLSNSSNVFEASRKILEDVEYSVVARNKLHSIIDSIGYSIKSIPDQFPEITVERVSDTSYYKFEYFTGEVSDDYGFRSLKLSGEIVNEITNDVVRNVNYEIDINDRSNIATFYYTLRLDSLKLREDEMMLAWFEVTDNDEVNNFKKSKSKTFIIKKKNAEEIKREQEESLNKSISSMEKGIREIKKINDEIEGEIERLIKKEDLNWNDRQRIKDIMRKQKDLMDKIENEKERVKRNLEKSDEIQKVDEKIFKKQKEMEKLLGEVMDEETRKIIEEINKLLEQFEKDRIREKLDQIQFNNEEVEQQLDRNIELLKQLQLEKKVNEVLEKIDETIKEQEKLRDNTEKGNEKNKKLSKYQEALQDEFEGIKDDLEEMDQKNQELEKSYEMPSIEEEQEQVSEEMKKSREMLNKGRYKKSIENQKKTSEGLKNMREQIFQFMQQMRTQQLGEDINLIREILENIIRISFEQEDLMLGFEKISNDDPNYKDIGKQQKNISDNIKKIKDSLFALSKRQISIESVVNKQIRKIDDNINKAKEQIEARRIRSGALRQQNVVTALNDLGLLIAESLKNMENNMAMQNQMQGKGNCSKPERWPIKVFK